MDNLDKKYTKEEQSEAFVFRNDFSEKEKVEASNELILARKKAKKQLNDNQIRYAKVLQLRFQMEDNSK